MIFLVRLARRLAKTGFALILVIVLAWFFREPLLRAAARAWIVDEPVTNADAIVVLGGGQEMRPFAAAAMYHAGKSPLVLVSQPRHTRSQIELGKPRDSDITAALLEKQGVPHANIAFFGDNVTSTRDEAVGLRDWIKKHPIHSVIIPTDPFHTRRTNWIFERELNSAGVNVTVVAIEHPVYSRDLWWKHEEGLITFLNELVKGLWYLVEY